jgi:anaerobic magnesium-protoporphyrin IX monomethyl ester cyclase
LNLFNKRAKLENYYTFINLTNQFNFNIDCGFIMFHPYSTFKDLVANAEFLKSIGLADTLCTFSSKLYLFPGTQIYKKLEVDNLLENTENNYYTLYDYKFIDEKVKILSDNMLKVNNILATKNFFHFKGITKLITYISRMRRKILKLGREYEVLLGDLLLIEQALNKMRTNINELNYQWFLECINWVQNDGTEAEYLQMLDFLLGKIEDEIYQVQKVQIKQGLKLQRILKM